MTGKRLLLLACAILLAALPPASRAGAQELEPLIRITQVDASAFPQVTVYLSVTDAAGEPLGVDPNLIRLYENGVPVDLEQVLGSGEAGPLTTLLVMDVSGSMYNGGKLEAARAAAKLYVTRMRPGDQVGLIAFNTRVSYVQPITGERAVLEAALDTLVPVDDTAMYDALLQAVQILQEVGGRKAIIVLTDGLDNASAASAEQVIGAVGPGGLSISTIGLGDPAAQGTNFGLDEEGLRFLAVRAGGVYGFAADSQSLQALYESYGRILQSEYRITYTSPSGLRDGLDRSLTVSLGEAGETPAGSEYNPGGVLPEVGGKSWGIYLGMLAGLVLLALLPGFLAWLRRRREATAAPAARKNSRIKLK